MEFIELYRAFIPRDKLMNDNHGQHYRIMQGKLNYLKAQFDAFQNGDPTYKSIVGGLTFEDAKEQHSAFVNMDEDVLEIQCQTWRANNIAFDPHNYEKTFKMPIDRLTTESLLGKDDNWKYISGSSYFGGGLNAWKRIYKTRNVNYDDEPIEVLPGGTEIMKDGLPKDMTLEWWNKYSDDLGALFIRIVAIKEDYKQND